jgi:hypothetical protein
MNEPSTYDGGVPAALASGACAARAHPLKPPSRPTIVIDKHILRNRATGYAVIFLMPAVAMLTFLRSCTALCSVLALVGCKQATQTSEPPPSNLTPRTFRMGFAANPPKPTTQSAVQTITAWSTRADAAIMHNSVPYKVLLGGTVDATTYVDSVDLPLANFYRGKGFPITITVDVTDGLNRSAEAPELVTLHRSIAEPAVQQVYRDYVKALVSTIRPEYLGLAAETNLIRDQAPPAVYGALVQMTNAAAADVRALGGKQPLLYTSIQADEAWGPPPASYRGAERDFQDFSFMQVLAISSYPYFFFSDPDQIPLDYYTRIANGRSLPIMVVEGGWTSAAVGSVQSTPAKQARYLRRQELMLDSAKAIAVFQLTYTDLDISAYQPLPAGSILPLFASLGHVDVNFVPKSSLATYDSIFARPLKK